MMFRVSPSRGKDTELGVLMELEVGHGEPRRRPRAIAVSELLGEGLQDVS